MKRIISVILLMVLLVGCAANTETQPAERAKGSEAKLESVEPEVIQPEKTISNFKSVISMLETKTLTGYDNDGNQYFLNNNKMEIHLDEPIIVQTVTPSFVVDTVTLEDSRAIGSCERQFKENHLLEKMCREHMDETIDLDYEEYYIQTPIKWLREYDTVEIVDTKTDVVVAGRISATKYTFEDGAIIWVNYKGIPVRVQKGDLVIGFHNVKVA